jgi:hypothetical protein
MAETTRTDIPAAAPAAVLPRPSPGHATCAWCRRDFGSIVELIDHCADHDESLRRAGGG